MVSKVEFRIEERMERKERKAAWIMAQRPVRVTLPGVLFAAKAASHSGSAATLRGKLPCCGKLPWQRIVAQQ
ncbi:hypothetical protein P40_06965 [Alloalcanivorax xenomutans]|nr:hypothetical protein P40_06965 [Alloalcanivorax xenomutans]